MKHVYICACNVSVPMFVWRESWSLHSGSLTDKTVGLTHLSKGEWVTQEIIFLSNLKIFWEGLRTRSLSIVKDQVPLKYKLRFLPSAIHFPLKYSFRFQSVYLHVDLCFFQRNKKLYILLLSLYKGKLWTFVYAVFIPKYSLLWPGPKN